MKAPINHNRFRAHLARTARTGIPGVLLAAALAVGGGMTQTALAGGHEADRSAGEVISDSWITTKVKSQLVADRDVSGLDISVETREGVVSLTGEAKNQTQVSKAVQIARSTDGVKRVDATGLRLETAVEQAKDVVDGGDGH